MKPALTRRQMIAPANWQELPMGPWLAAEIQERLDAWCPMFFGYHLLKVGALSSQLSCNGSSISHQCAVAPFGEKVGLLGEPSAIPLQDSSVDACILAQTLDYAADPHQVLREIERVLTADGWLILSGFNPHSLVGIGRLFRRLRRHQPWHARMFAPERVADWLELLGFEIIHLESFGFSTLSQHSRIHWWRENIGRSYFSFFASVYIIAARKRTIPLTPEPRAVWFKKSVLAGEMARI